MAFYLQSQPETTEPTTPKMEFTVPLPGPDATQRMDPADFKGYLDVYGYWKLDNVEHTWALFRNITGPNKTVAEHRRIVPHYQAAADDYYRRFKEIVVNEMTRDDGFCGGAFREKVTMTSPFTDIFTFVLASPVICKEHRSWIKGLVAKLYYEMLSTLRSEATGVGASLDEEYFKSYLDKLPTIERAFKHTRVSPGGILLPDDISDAWLNEFGPQFTANYRKALDGNPAAPFKVVRGVRNIQFGLTLPHYGHMYKPEPIPLLQGDIDDEGFDYNNFGHALPSKDGTKKKFRKAVGETADQRAPGRGRFGNRLGFSKAPQAVSGNVPNLKSEPSIGSIRRPKVGSQYEDRFEKAGVEVKAEGDGEEEQIGLEDFMEGSYIGHGQLQMV